MINEEIYDITSGSHSVAERLGYIYGEIKKRHKYKFLFDPLRSLLISDFINQYLDGHDPFPQNIEIDLSNACNHDCPFCIYSSLHKKGHNEILKKGVVESVLAEFKNIGGKSLLFIGGGEPLVHKSCVDIIEYANNLGLSVGLVTNGSIIKPGDFERLKKNCTYIRFSIDAGTSDTYQIMHKCDDFEKVITNLAVLCAAPGKATVGVSYFISEANFHECALAAKLFKKIGSDYVQFKTYSGLELAADYYDLLLAALEQALQLSDELFDVHIMERILEQNTFQVRDYSKCHWQAFKTIIGADGNVYLCAQRRGKKDSVIGNVYNNTLQQIWKGDQRKAVIDNLITEKCPYCVHHVQNKHLDFFYNYSESHKGFY